MGEREAFLAGDRPEDVWMYFAEEGVSGVDALAEYGERVGDGVVLVVEGDSGRSAFRNATGQDPMAFAKRAMETDGDVDRDCTGGTCPASDDPGPHDARLVFAFVEERNEDAGGLYAEGDVVHAYVSCSCGRAYSEKWVAGGR